MRPASARKSHVACNMRLQAAPHDTLSIVKEVHSGSSYLSQNALRVHFGLGKYTQINVLELQWPSGLTEQFFDLKPNQILRIKEGSGIENVSAE